MSDTIHVNAQGAVPDGVLIADAEMAVGSAVLYSAAGHFDAGLVGKLAQVEGAGSGGGLLTTAIVARNSANEIVLASPNASGAAIVSKRAQFGTDNTAVINAALALRTRHERLQFGLGVYLVSSLNATNTGGLIEGEAMGDDNPACYGTILLPIGGGNTPLLDLTGSGSLKTREMQIGHRYSPVVGKAGILIANAASIPSHLLSFERVFVSGTWAYTPVLVYGVGDSCAEEFYFWNHSAAIVPALALHRNNAYGIQSAYQTLATGERGCGNWNFRKGELHSYAPPGQTSGFSLYTKGAQALKFDSVLFDSSTVNVQAESAPLGTQSLRHTFDLCTFYSENGTPPVSCLQTPDALYSRVLAANCEWSFRGSKASGNVQLTEIP